ncbi:DNA-directed RNA polymerase III subunit RPC10-like isoform X1 [Selaginella moellendorffii]|uniref:DNA-directed RNA polymerase III subunit RPC10-like isoform X1 n=1 Tax=Selaginella moellendorffii TaxID=88036 RepID=UPI000D1CFD08|nr:DNA-directed RNA polymerase III subunit RPC10-like isoform X1 [Selaginella moellendorffii]|eukprot:XP_024522140.1 DNA-directed RNA polymerase III subunit RPC10-like isoform X1 [Selaginella moellendorffii]
MLEPAAGGARWQAEILLPHLCIHFRRGPQGLLSCFLSSFTPLPSQISKPIPLKNKEVDDVMGGEDAWKNCDRTPVTCAKCNYGHAYFMLVQIRSADEPSTAFYRCCNPNCSFRWRED